MKSFAEIPDETLVTKVLQGETEAFAFIVDRYKVQIYNLMYRFSDTSEDAADMTQEVFCKAFERLNQYKKRKRFFSWLYTLALNHARDWTKKKNSRQRNLARFAVATEKYEAESAHFLLEVNQETDSLSAALATLPDDRREMVLLRYRHERSIKELAEIFDLSESAVKMRLHRALGDLRSQLKKTDYG
ncbi:MAG: sigma-70 family RNA polymerase sigma factor [Desulfofustis sp.]|nr:sigma-70 family RNA polymerase sigma factor [Desulfofustis sp.]NNK14984.1 sigma-70 family RNA polymerase sigma factor [Desulfofustis sp.]RZW22351.1 MAG: sigma-70 family RNA polymerase sigma factor [Desulfobulbaceae bacterium]